jgi:streptogramin lyase
MPGTAYEKRLFVNSCTNSCHSGDRPFLQKFSAADWNKIVNRMTNYYLRTLVASSGQTELQADAKVIANWLSRVRGLDSEYPQIEPFPRPTGMATRAIVTEYEVPWALVNVHDVSGDAQGNIWFNVNRSPFVGKLDPKTGKVVSYRVEPLNHPALPYNQKTTEELGVHPGLHWIQADHRTGYVWFSDTWAGTINRLDPNSGEIKTAVTRLQGNMGLSPDGLSVWRTADGKLKKYDTKTLFDHGNKVVEPTQEWPLKITRGNYGNFVSKDSNYVGGGGDTIVWFDVRKNELREIPLTIGGSKGRGTFDHEGNVWAGAEKLTKYDPKTGAVTQYTPPTPYYHSYSAKVDKNGEIWSGQQSGGRIGRFNPRTGLWIEYALPTAWSFDFNAWIDDSTTPPTFWYGDQHGYIVRLQPLE